MGRRVVSAVQLSDIFEKRFREMHPLSSVVGIQIKAEGSGEWLPLAYLGSMNEALSVDGAAILGAMKAEFLIDE